MTAIPATAQKTDIVEFGDGSRLVGEVKGLDRGMPYFKTDTIDTITIDRTDVTRVVTMQRLRIDVRDGKRYFGVLIGGRSCFPSAEQRLRHLADWPRTMSSSRTTTVNKVSKVWSARRWIGSNTVNPNSIGTRR